MNILVVCQYYYPEPFRITDICEELVKRGNSVTVVTGEPNYPEGIIYDGYGHGKRCDEIINGVKVHRSFTVARRTGALFRLCNYYSYMLSSSSYIKKLGDFDAVFVYQLSPVMMANAGIKYAKKHNKKAVLYCLDLWPESVTASGMRPGSALYNHFYKVSEKIYKSCDKIAVTSFSFKKYFSDKFGIDNAVYMPQYCEDLFDGEKCRKAPDEYTDIMFAGNVGAAQSMETVVGAAELTKDNKKIRWHIVGDGSELEKSKKAVFDKGLENVFFYGRHKTAEMPEFYSKADIMLVTMKKGGFGDMTLPGKIQSYMSSGKPILCSADGEASRTVKEAGCGLCSPAEDTVALAENAVKMSEENISAYAEKSLEYSRENFSKERFFKTLEELLR